MSPVAYGLRDHVVFSKPFPIDRSKIERRKTPNAWKGRLEATEVEVLPVAAERGGMAGWCTYDASILGSPEVEIMCGGINTKMPEAAAVWRQGNLLHFGFEEHPGQLNDNGRRILLNSIAYISRFTKDRPLVTTPSGFVHKIYPRPRRYLRAVLKKRVTPDVLARYFAPEWSNKVKGMEPDAALAWVRARLDYLCADTETGRLTLDADAEALGIALGTGAVFDKAKESDDDRLLPLLRRRFPAGPRKADLAGWRTWLAAHRRWLFFDEPSGYVWILDALAKKRGVPSAKLRGPLRADGG